MSEEILPMFPLGTVLLPGGLLPLHIFEERYRSMIEDILSTDQKFGVVLIKEGLEVGGMETRSEIGTIAQIIEFEYLADGRYLLIVKGTKRIFVSKWLPDSPYPQAEVELLYDEIKNEISYEYWKNIKSQMRRVLALLSELGDDVPPITLDISEDPVVGSFEMASALPLSSQEGYEILSKLSAEGRCSLLTNFLDLIENHAQQRLLNEEGPRGTVG
tara:strand:+ start:413 stop:1060 length:648 start_codon:yes stop_codon:yes gene_type:complete